MATPERAATAEARLAFYYRPWLWAEAEARGLTVIDFETMFLSLPDWGDGSGYFQIDGIHARPVGEQLMADLVLLPEPPATLALMSGAGLLLFLRRVRAPNPQL